jgi:hypothetical protein
LTLTPTSVLANGQNCYSTTELGLQLPTTLSRTTVQGPDVGWSDTLVWVAEAPAGDTRDYGRVRVACVRAQFVAPSVRLPLGPTVTLTDSDFYDPAVLDRSKDCVGGMP